ncbi:MAG: UbiX family flavin prenyltransferase [Hyphomicrobiaceae bacterium]|nr:UbiX family flavin prenyltransferase [Hyphomicrobiaceae bacterium]
MCRIRRVVLAITGASGAAIGLRIAEILHECAIETHLVISSAGERTITHEIGPDGSDRIGACVSYRHLNDDIGAAIASGSFRTAGMIVAPCSMRALGAIAACTTTDLITRAADVHLKERRRLVLLARESPLHLGHLRAMAAATEFGAIIAPPVPAFYLRPVDIAGMVDQIARRAIELLRIDRMDIATEWMGEQHGEAP